MPGPSEHAEINWGEGAGPDPMLTEKPEIWIREPADIWEDGRQI